MKKNSKLAAYTAYYIRFLKNILNSYFQFDGLPPSISEWYLKKLIFDSDNCVAFEYKGEVITTAGALSGLNVRYEPTAFTPANPYVITDKIYTPGVDCVPLYVDGDYMVPYNFDAMLSIYARRLADIDLSIDTSVRNSRASQILLVDDDKEAIRTGKLLDSIYDEGKAAVLSYRTSFNKDDKPFMVPIKARDNIVTSELADARRNVLADFYHSIGIETIAVDKKERTNLREMGSNDQQLKINADIWRKNISKWCEGVNNMFGTSISFSLNEGEAIEATGPLEDEEVEND